MFLPKLYSKGWRNQASSFQKVALYDLGFWSVIIFILQILQLCPVGGNPSLKKGFLPPNIPGSRLESLWAKSSTKLMSFWIPIMRPLRPIITSNNWPAASLFWIKSSHLLPRTKLLSDRFTTSHFST